ncbi:ranBP-type and C3HC4-type zinc finger-containing protein 1 isoform X1 [Osmerus mordax]|uniref:ranBP-type and C3HC4-type zinc finger-containing protein 1 isoform X1 n=2 Tax=Osmerus mordax TaxID=8014 RepID=UPI003510928C
MSVAEDSLKEAEELAQLLGEALSSGDREKAHKCSERLSDLGIPVSVKVSNLAYPQDAIKLKVGVGDSQSENYIPVTVLVSVDMTISELKEKINSDYGFHPYLQRWVIGKRLTKDDDTLYSHGICKNGDQAYLYIQSCHAAKLTRQHHLQDQEHRLLDSIYESVYLAEPQALGGNAIEKLTPPPKPTVTRPPPPPPKPQVGWSCPECTYVNKPTRPGCEMCGRERPAEYQVPDVHQPDQEEIQRIKQEEMANLQYHQVLHEERQRNFQSLLETDFHSLVPNTQEVLCPICFNSVLPGEGATLRECLHCFCKECLKGTIVTSMDAEVSCPYGDENYSCDSKLQDREIKSLLTPEEHQKFLELRLSIAETRSENSFHCKTPDCAGWCIFEDEVNEFNCELCSETNCLLCKAIHKDMNCKEYQDDLRIRAENDDAAKQTTQMLEGLLQSGEAMHCPKCKVIVQKKDGCDWICCLMCKTEICWVTKQARWGPKGTGDTSGGCGCNFNVARCHPNCQNCH